MTTKFKAEDFSTSADKRDLLGRGNYASVRRCFHPRLDNVVVKCFAIVGSAIAIAKIEKNVEKEAKVLCRLNHANIIKCHGVTQWSKYYGLVLEEGLKHNMEDLLVYSLDKDISWPLRLRFAADVSKGLDYLHHENNFRTYIHGDLKPQNILFDQQLVAKIADFGAVQIRKATNASTTSSEGDSTNQYSLLYSAPEFLKNIHSTKTTAMDVYSFSMILYEIITRRHVFETREKIPIPLLRKLIEDIGQKPRLKFAHDIENCLTGENKMICTKLQKTMIECWDTDPTKRPSIKDVKKDLEETEFAESFEVQHLIERSDYSAAVNHVSLREFEQPFEFAHQVSTIDSTSMNTEIAINIGSEQLQDLPESETSSRIIPGPSNYHKKTKQTIRSGNDSDEDISPSEYLLQKVPYPNTPQGSHPGTYKYRISEPSKPRPVTRLRHCVSYMKETQKYKSVFKKISNKPKIILHCFGVSGSGKSQIARKLAELFPFFGRKKYQTPNVIKWHIQCKDSGHNVREELSKLSEALLKNHHINDKSFYQSVKEDLNEGNTKKLVSLLCSSNFPALIIVEDPDPDKNSFNNKVLEDLLRNLSSNSLQSEDKPSIHVYITSRSNERLLEDNQTNSNIYYKEHVVGFNESEAIEYFEAEKVQKESIKESVIQIYRKFNGSPLGLQAAKSYCMDSGNSYTAYLEVLENVKYDVVPEEKDSIAKEFGDSAKHIFAAILLTFMPLLSKLEELDIISNLHWKMLHCLSNFNYDRIPRSALEYCARKFIKTAEQDLNVKDVVEKLVSKLITHNLCSETVNKEITFHEVVINAFRFNRYHTVFDTHFYPLKEAIEVMSGLVSKDMRHKHRSLQMGKLLRHLQSLLSHVERDEKLLYDNVQDGLMLKTLTSHLYETAAAIMLMESAALFSNESERYFEKALKLIWEDEDDWKYKGKAFDPKIAERIVEQSQKMGKLLHDTFTLDYASNLEICFDEKEMSFIKSQISNEKDSKEFEKLVTSNQPQKLLLQHLQTCKLFLSNDKYASIFYAERVASILHSYSHHVLYADINVARHDNKCLWMTKLSNNIAVECRKKCGVSLLTEQLSEINGSIPIVLKLKKKEIEENVKARDFCTEILSKEKETFNLYENGLVREVFGPSKIFTRISLLRSITRFNTRLLKSAKNKVDLNQSDRYCDELFHLSVENQSEMSSSLMCIIYCAKYHVAKNNPKKAVQDFYKFFEITDDENLAPKFNVRCWAVYNYARAVCSFPELKGRAKKVIRRCEEVLNGEEVMSKDLEKRLKNCLKELR